MIKAKAQTIKDLEHATKDLAAEITELFWYKIETDLETTRKSASSDDLAALDELYTGELEKLKRHFKLKTGLDAFSGRPLRKLNARTPGSEAPPKLDER